MEGEDIILAGEAIKALAAIRHMYAHHYGDPSIEHDMSLLDLAMAIGQGWADMGSACGDMHGLVIRAAPFNIRRLRLEVQP